MKIRDCWLGIFCLLKSIMAVADCDLVFPTSVYLGNYDPNQPMQTPVSWYFDVYALKGCNLHLQFEDIDASGAFILLGPENSALRIVMAHDYNGYAPVKPAPNDFMHINLVDNEKLNFQLWLIKPPNKWLPAGLYACQIRLRNQNDAGQTTGFKDINFQINVIPSVNVSLGQAGGYSNMTSAILDFGILANGEQRKTQLLVQANTPYSVSLQSDQGGFLTNLHYPAEKIPYKFRMDNVLLDLTKGEQTIQVSNLQNSAHTLDVEIGAIEKILAGQYSDTLLMTISAQ